MPDRSGGPTCPQPEDSAEIVASAIVRFTAFGDLGEDDLALLRSLGGATRHLKRGEVLRHEGAEDPAPYLLLDGWTSSSVTFSDGRRQMLRINMPGDMLGSPSLALTHAADTILALSPATVVTMQMKAMTAIFAGSPRLAAILYLIAQEERLGLTDRLAAIHRTRAIERVAGLFIQLYDRHARYQPPEKHGRVPHPLTQGDAADLVGISTVHMNRTLQDLQRRGLLRWSRGEIRIMDVRGLRDLAGLPERHLRKNPDWLPS